MDFGKASIAWYRDPKFIDMTDRQRVLLVTVCDAGAPVAVRDLANALNVQKPVISRAVNTLGALGLLRREQGVEDKRQCYIAPTTEGLAVRLAMHTVRL